MTRPMMWLGTTTLLTTLAMASTGCVVGGDEQDEAVGEARQAQLDPGWKDYVLYTLTQNGVQVGKVLVTATTGGGYTGSREYWYMNQNVATGSSLTFSSGAPDTWSNPPSGLGTLSFTTQRRPLWVSGTPSTTMELYTNPLTGERVGIDWQMSDSGGTWTGSINWWHSTTGNIFGANQSITLSPGTPASGSWYSYTTAPL